MVIFISKKDLLGQTLGLHDCTSVVPPLWGGQSATTPVEHSLVLVWKPEPHVTEQSLNPDHSVHAMNDNHFVLLLLSDHKNTTHRNSQHSFF